MKIYFDSKDIINIIEKSTPFSVDDLEHILKSGGHELVLSFLTIMEISEPLLHKKAKSNIMGLLNRIEKLPHTFIHSSSITRIELIEAYEAFSKGREYNDINPYVSRFDETCDLSKKPPTHVYINYSLSGTVWDLYCFGAVGGLDAYGEKLRKIFMADRSMTNQPTPQNHFTTTVERLLSLYGLKIPSTEIEPLSSWIYDNPTRCPSERLGYELWHKMLKNITDIPTNSDMEDYNHLCCLPYVDLMTLDRRMFNYVAQASKGLELSYDSKAAKIAKVHLPRNSGHTKGLGYSRII
ncbi:MAG: hypothetical protein Q8P28_02700 [Deltaproteobacteria bacterium]|nr:hypothetical protein [Deltaproteobacteria bacterium]